MSPYYFKTVTDEKTYMKKSEVAQPLSQLPVISGSRWGAEHLKACHVVVNSKVGYCLPVLHSYDRAIRETFKPGEENAHIAAFINGLAREHRKMRQHALVQEPEVGATLARFWTALRDVKTLKSDKEEQKSYQRTSSRVKSQTTYPGYVNSEVIASSSQDHEDNPASSFATSTGSFTSEQVPAVHLPVELYTVELALAAINHILLYTQNPSSDRPVEIRQQERWLIQIGNKRITAIDDGGLTLIDDDGERTENSVVLLEAKRRLDVCDEANRPFVSDELLGQMTCEAIAARSSRQSDNERDDIFIVNITQQYMCFFHFIITADHLENIEHGRITGKAIKVTATHWFNLERPSDRKCIVKNVLQLAEYMKQIEEEE
ncbi:hypothetical protein J7337_003356 [Fusarium musae]|uniref:Uncharacterized protein n=1 Tax=Fusarium musae TaxID=1042133 RepID=A0A9P8DQW2_9HYPO|nr:hypothetical protein J7337_003356 [Fusarium musae]KAG9506373.1 hypothetical protein J7337_003356 [Fusarium musae]